MIASTVRSCLKLLQMSVPHAWQVMHPVKVASCLCMSTSTSSLGLVTAGLLVSRLGRRSSQQSLAHRTHVHLMLAARLALQQSRCDGQVYFHHAQHAPRYSCRLLHKSRRHSLCMPAEPCHTCHSSAAQERDDSQACFAAVCSQRHRATAWDADGMQVVSVHDAFVSVEPCLRRDVLTSQRQLSTVQCNRRSLCGEGRVDHCVVGAQCSCQGQAKHHVYADDGCGLECVADPCLQQLVVVHAHAKKLARRLLSW